MLYNQEETLLQYSALVNNIMKLTKNLFFYPEKGMLDCNTYVIKGDLTVIIDPGSPQFLPLLLQDLSKDGIDAEDIGIIANTHLHGDHSGANEAFKKVSKAEITLHPVQKQYYDVAVIETSKLFGFQPTRFAEDDCADSDKLSSGNTELDIIKTPGHSPDSVCFYSQKDKIMVCGDVIFDVNVGRVDLPGGSAAELKQSINELSQLEIEYLLPGHMDIVTGIARVAENFDYVKKQILQWL